MSRPNPILLHLRRLLRPTLTTAFLTSLTFLTTPALPSDAPDFATEVLPILSDACFVCHGPDDNAKKGGLRLDSREGALAPGKSGTPAVVPGHPAKSELIRRILTDDPDDRMPPEPARKPLDPRQKDTLQRWVASGASWGRHWAYSPPVRHPLPAPNLHPIDAFIHERLQREGLQPAPPAPRETLIRRVTLDLTGLPPTPEEIDAFLADDSPDAWERVVDRLLASPRYGERMAWDWLDAARYADSNGYQGDAERTMWPWRDWVVDALNRNLPFDTFSLWQLAGDLLPNAGFEQRLATGFLRNHMINGEGGRIPEENRIDYLFDQTETVGTVWLAATLNCARCHDHKFDPISQRDYYGLLAFFNQTAVDGSGGDPQSRPNLEVPSLQQFLHRKSTQDALEQAAHATSTFESSRFPRTTNPSPPTPDTPPAPQEDLPKEIQDILASRPLTRDAARLEKLANHWRPSEPAYASLLDAQRKALAARDAAARAIPRVMVMEDMPNPRATFVLRRGLYNQPDAAVTAAVPPDLSPTPSPHPNPASLTNRLTLAQWLLDPAHPLTARVTVNRYWQLFFATGLVKTSEDFGLQGEQPSHPKLLDWLASEFIASGWNPKHIHRLIVTSQTYRQSSSVDPDQRERDPENRLLARGPRFRMPSWMIRDAALASSGLLVERLGGPPVHPYQPAGVWEEATFGNKRYVQDHGDALYRRSLYVFWRRIVAPTLFFDVANRQTCTVRTPQTNVPLHALATLNDTTFVEAARTLAQHVLLLPNANDPLRLNHAARRVLGRRLAPDETRILLAGLARHRTRFTHHPDEARRWLAHGESPRNEQIQPAEHAAWTLVCNTLLNLDEALTRE
jgi:hypothetical protein